ncbi:molybdopterin-dependent oxidoreductase [Rhizobium vallis]|nr:molybdopterin-dependent oxidoreductase [Rhizobium vallis]
MTEQIAGWCALCKSRCGATFTVSDGKLIGAGPLPEHPTGKSLCVKGKAAPEILYSPDRLLYPQRRTKPKTGGDPGWVRITWEEAYREIGERLRDIRHRHGPEALSFATTTPSGTSISDGDDWIDRLIRLTTPNWICSQEVCNWHRDSTHQLTVGTSVPYPDWARTDLVVLWGFNPSSVWLDQATQVAAARARGAKVLVVDPRRFGFAIGADHWLRVRPGSDGILMLGMIRHILETEQYDKAFIQRWSNGAFLVRKDTGRFLRGRDIDADAPPDSYVVSSEAGLQFVTKNDEADGEKLLGANLASSIVVDGRNGAIECRTSFEHFRAAACARTLEGVSAATWVPVEDIIAAANTLGQSKSAAYYTWTGLCQHATATQTDRALASLMSLKGCYDTPGGNVLLPSQPVNKIHGDHLLDPELLRKTVGIDERPLGPPGVGRVVAHDFYSAVLDSKPYKVRALVDFGLNLAVSHGDSSRGRDALAALDFYVHCDIFENPSSRFADILLPVNTFYERDAMRVGFTSGLAAEEHIQYRPKLVEPAGETRSDAEIAFAIADELGLREQFFGGSIDAGRQYILQPLGIDLEELKKTPGGIRRPLEQRYRKYAEVADGSVTGFKTETGLVELYSEVLARENDPPVPDFLESDLPGNEEYPFALTTAKTVYYCHSQHRNIPSLRKREPDPSVFLAPETADELLLEEGDWANVVTAKGWITMRVKHDKSLHPRVVRASYGWWQANREMSLPGYDPFTNGGSNYNMLLDSTRLDRVSGSSPHRSLSCNVVAVNPRPKHLHGWRGFRDMQVVRTQRVADEVTAIWIQASDGGVLPDYQPGQHITVQTDDPNSGEQLIRCYSLVGSAVEEGRKTYQIAVRFVPRPHNRPDLPDGRMSSVMNRHLSVDHKIQVQAPSGRFVIPAESARPIVLVAGGIGITPMICYLETIATLAQQPRVHLVYANRSRETEAFADRLTELKARIPSLTITRVWEAGEGELPYGVRVGFASVTDILVDDLKEAPEVFFCGPPPMTAALRKALIEAGDSSELVLEEAFTAVQGDVSKLPEGPFKITFAKSDKTVIWKRENGSLLELAEAQGIKITNGCRAGQCESCEVRILGGECTHRIEVNHDGGETCLACQAVPTADLLIDA